MIIPTSSRRQVCTYSMRKTVPVVSERTSRRNSGRGFVSADGSWTCFCGEDPLFVFGLSPYLRMSRFSPTELFKLQLLLLSFVNLGCEFKGFEYGSFSDTADAFVSGL